MKDDTGRTNLRSGGRCECGGIIRLWHNRVGTETFDTWNCDDCGKEIKRVGA